MRIAAGSGLQLGEILLVSDCVQGDIFQLSNADASASGQLFHDTGSGAPGNVVGTLSKVYDGTG